MLNVIKLQAIMKSSDGLDWVFLYKTTKILTINNLNIRFFISFWNLSTAVEFEFVIRPKKIVCFQ